MKTILEYFKELDKSKEWNYYNNQDLAIVKDWSDQAENTKFIKKYLTISEKIGILDHFDFAINKNNHINRAIHTNSVFFLGCLFYKKLNLIDEIVFYRDDGRDEFYFIWFLTSLVHDFGYDVEEDFKTYRDEFTEDIESIKTTYNLLDYNNEGSEELKTAYHFFRPKIKIIIEDITNYYQNAYRGHRSSRCNKKIEHGIYAGLKLYDALVKNRKEREDQQNDDWYWGKELDRFYAIASFSIAIHNMRRDEIDKCKGIDCKISISDNPFLFLFGLVDTLELTKVFDNCNSEYVLENIIFEFCKDIIIIANHTNSKLKFVKLYKKAKGLEDWLDVKVTRINANKLKIKIR